MDLVLMAATALLSDTTAATFITSNNAYDHPVDARRSRGFCGDLVISQNTSCDTLTTAGVSCGSSTGTTENTFARNFTIPSGSEGAIFCIDFGVETLTIDTEVILEIFSSPTSGAPVSSSLTLLTQQASIIPAGDSFIHRIAINAPPIIGAGNNIVAAITVPDLQPQESFFYFGGDSSVQGSTYIKSSECGLNDYVDVSDIGFPDSQMTMCLGITSSGFDPCLLPLPNYCPEDINNDFAVNTFDILEVVSGYGSTGDGSFRPNADIAPLPNGDCTVNTLDLLAIVSQLGSDCTPTGSCCFDDGSCEDGTISDCNINGGAYQGDFSTCNTSACSRGSCCLPDLSCEQRSEESCLDSGGIFTPWLYCNEITCGPGACCLDPFTCLDNFDNALCTEAGGIYLGNGSFCESNSCATEPPLEQCEGNAFTNSGESSNAGTSDNNAGYSRFTEIAGVESITTITVTGLSMRYDVDGGFVAGCDSIKTFEIACYLGNDQGLPDLTTPIFLNAEATPISIIDLNIPFSISGLYEYTFNLELNSLPSSPLWIGVKANGNEDCWFLWANSSNGSGNSAILDTTNKEPILALSSIGPLSICINGGGSNASCCVNGICIGDLPESECVGLNGTFNPFESCTTYDGCGCNLGEFSTAGTADEGAGYQRASTVEGFSTLSGFEIRGIEYNYDVNNGFDGPCSVNESLSFDVSVVALGSDGLPNDSIVFYTGTLNEDSIDSGEEFAGTTIYDYNFTLPQPVAIPGEAVVVIKANSPCNSSGCELSSGGCWFLWLDTDNNTFTGFINDGSGWASDISLAICGN